MLTASRSDKWHPRFSPDGSRVSFSTPTDNIYVMPASGGTPEMVCQDCREAIDWSSDGKRIIGNSLEAQARVLDVASHRKTDLLATRRGSIPAPFRLTTAGSSSETRRPAAPTSRLSANCPFPRARGSPSWTIGGGDSEWYGNLIYAVLGRDGFSCIWAQRLDAVTKRPVGAPFAVFHAHNARMSLANQGEVYLAIGRDKILFSMGEHTGNIWMAEFKP